MAKSQFVIALDAYKKAVERSEYWRYNGYRGDGMLEETQENERVARLAVIKAHKAK